MNEQIDILALGKSIRRYKDTGAYKIGVNDIDKYVTPDCLVIVDHVFNFTTERLDTIFNTGAKHCLSQLEEWERLPGFVQIKLATPNSLWQMEKRNIYPYSVVSAYVAAVHAYKIGAKHIRICGVDMLDDYKCSPKMKMQTVNDFYKLRMYLEPRGVKMSVCTHMSILSGIMPVEITG